MTIAEDFVSSSRDKPGGNGKPGDLTHTIAPLLVLACDGSTGEPSQSVEPGESLKHHCMILEL